MLPLSGVPALLFYSLLAWGFAYVSALSLLQSRGEAAPLPAPAPAA